MDRANKNRAEQKVVVRRRVAFFRNEMNKAWIGAKRAQDPRAAMVAKAKLLIREHCREKPVVRQGIREWWTKHERQVGECPASY